MNKIPAITGEIIGLPEWAKRKLHDKDWNPMLVYVAEDDGINFYMHATHWYDFELQLQDSRLHEEDGTPLTFETAKPYLKAFSEGFHEGYLNFNIHDELRNQQGERRRIYQIVSIQNKGFTFILDRERNCTFITIESSHESGVSAGEWYHALYLMINNYELFNEFYENKNIPALTFAGGLQELALFCIYSKVEITRQNQSEKASEHGYRGKASKLYQYYCEYSTLQNRIGVKGSERKNAAHMKRLCKVISLLETNSRAYIQAVNDRKIFSDKTKTDIPETL